jgi:hypothetical protein
MIKSIVPAMLFGVLATGSAWANIPALEFNPSLAMLGSAADLTAGWSFTTNQAITVTALDAFDPTGTGLVQIYNGSGNVLASATLNTSDAKEGNPTSFYTQAIAPVTLVANTTYYISEDINGGIVLFRTGPLTLDPSITYNGEVSGSGLGQTPTTDAFAGGLNPGFFGPNFDISPTVPEPSTTVLTGLLFGFVAAYAGLRSKLNRSTWRQSRP